MARPDFLGSGPRQRPRARAAPPRVAAPAPRNGEPQQPHARLHNQSHGVAIMGLAIDGLSGFMSWKIAKLLHRAATTRRMRCSFHSSQRSQYETSRSRFLALAASLGSGEASKSRNWPLAAATISAVRPFWSTTSTAASRRHAT